MTTFNHEEHYLALGRLVFTFAMLEMTLRSIINGLLKTPVDISMRITARSSYRDLVDLATSLFQYRCSDKVLFDKFIDIIKRANKLEEERNRFIHSTWFKEDADAWLFRLKVSSKFPDGLKIQYEPTDIPKVNETAENIFNVGNELIQFYLNNTGSLTRRSS